MHLRLSLPLPEHANSPARNIQRAFGYDSALLILVTTLGAKAWTTEFTSVGWRRQVNDFCNLVHVWNTGAAFTLLADAGAPRGPSARWHCIDRSMWLIAVLPVPMPMPMPMTDSLAYGLVHGGAAGNGIDRAWHGHVVDFLDLHWKGWHWPAFNIADIGIVSAAKLLASSAFRSGANAHR